MLEYSKLPLSWKRIFELEWQSVCEGSKAIAAVIVSEDGEILSEGRNMISESFVPNPATAHAEVEAVRNLDISKYPYPKQYVMYVGLEPCPMCMGTIVMGHIRNVVIAARDDFGGATDLLQHSDFLRGKNMNIVWAEQYLGDIQRGMQTIRELLYNKDADKLSRMLNDFSVYNAAGVRAARQLVEENFLDSVDLSSFTASEIYNLLLHNL
ncbi:MAG: nucleoside deaminase [Oscillospiraceae bacterium]|nr:nucleoside deaminase [Oscillospiraceae bacterium]